MELWMCAQNSTCPFAVRLRNAEVKARALAISINRGRLAIDYAQLALHLELSRRSHEARCPHCLGWEVAA
jgi:hypothetical protein